MRGSTPEGHDRNMRGSTPEGHDRNMRGSTPEGHDRNMRGSTPEGHDRKKQARINSRRARPKHEWINSRRARPKHEWINSRRARPNDSNNAHKLIDKGLGFRKICLIPCRSFICLGHIMCNALHVFVATTITTTSQPAPPGGTRWHYPWNVVYHYGMQQYSEW